MASYVWLNKISNIFPFKFPLALQYLIQISNTVLLGPNRVGLS